MHTTPLRPTPTGAVARHQLPARTRLVARVAGHQSDGDGIYSLWHPSGRLAQWYWHPLRDQRAWSVTGETCGHYLACLAVVDDYGTLVIVADRFSHIVPATEVAQ